MKKEIETTSSSTHSSVETSWGSTNEDGAEIWDTRPTFLGDQVTLKDWLKLLFYPKKFFLYLYVRRYIRKCFVGRGGRRPPSSSPLHRPPLPVRSDSRGLPLNRGRGDGTVKPRILDVGCGTGASVVDFKKMFGRSVEVVGIDVVLLQIELAKEKIKKNGVWAEVEYYDGVNIPYPAEYFDAIYTSDVLGHVEDVPEWLSHLNRVLKPGGVLAMFNESKLGRHAYIRNYLFKRGLNVDPHAEAHISLYSKSEMKKKINEAGFEIKKMRSMFWASFLVHPDEFYEKLSKTKKFPFLRMINSILYRLKKKTHPFSTAAAELYGLVESFLVGSFVESQGYVVLARKQENKHK